MAPQEAPCNFEVGDIVVAKEKLINQSHYFMREYKITTWAKGQKFKVISAPSDSSERGVGVRPIINGLSIANLGDSLGCLWADKGFFIKEPSYKSFQYPKRLTKTLGVTNG